MAWIERLMLKKRQGKVFIVLLIPEMYTYRSTEYKNNCVLPVSAELPLWSFL
jgi:hypothetical protein